MKFRKIDRNPVRAPNNLQHSFMNCQILYTKHSNAVTPAAYEKFWSGLTSLDTRNTHLRKPGFTTVLLMQPIQSSTHGTSATVSFQNENRFLCVGTKDANLVGQNLKAISSTALSTT